MMASEAIAEFRIGNRQRALDGIRAALARSRSDFVLQRAAHILAEAGDEARARDLMMEVTKESPTDTMVHSVFVPMVKALIEMNRGRGEEAIALMNAAMPYDRALPGSRRIRALAYLRARRGPDAVQEIRAILDLRSLEPTNPIYSVLRVELARAYALSGDTAKSRQSYQDFLALWSDADPDLPLLQKARDEYARLR
jgi:predicted Zn-dependent protease